MTTETDIGGLVERTISGETVCGVQIAGYRWKIAGDASGPAGFMWSYASHWSTGPADAERLVPVSALQSAQSEAAALRVERDEARAKANISLDTLPFWPWLWADPLYERRGDVENTQAMAEKRLRVNYETAREPIPNQYALVHRGDIQTLMHELWRKRALSGLLPEMKARAESAEAREAALRERVGELEKPIGMQDVRLVAGEGKLGDSVVLQAVNVIIAQRAKDNT